MDIGEVLSKAWEIIWKHKVLWLYGILAGCTTQWGSNFNFNFGGGKAGRGFPFPGIQQFFSQMERRFQTLPEGQVALIMAVIFLIILGLVLIALLLSTLGRIGLIRGVTQADQGVTRLTVGGIFREAKPYFWRVLGLNLLLFIVFAAFIFLFAVSAAIFTAFTFGIGILCLLPLICLLVPLFWALSIVLEQANVALVVEDLSIPAAFRRGLEVFQQNVGNLLLMGLILTFGGVAISFVLALPILLIVSPIVIGNLVGSEAVMRGGILVAGLCLLAYLPLVVLLNGVLQAYLKSAWTLTYLRLTGTTGMIEGPEVSS